MEIGLFFGSFNPVHIGHLIIANHLLGHTALEQVWFVVSPQNPLKPKQSLLNEYDRLHLVELAIEDNDRLRSSNVEFNLPRPSYTVDTLAYLFDKHPQHHFSLLMGSDNLNSLRRWKNHEQILKHHHIYVYRRDSDMDQELERHPSVTILEGVPILAISASFIREQVREGRSIQYLVPDQVRDYIEKANLFR